MLETAFIVELLLLGGISIVSLILLAVYLAGKIVELFA